MPSSPPPLVLGIKAVSATSGEDDKFTVTPFVESSNNAFTFSITSGSVTISSSVFTTPSAVTVYSVPLTVIVLVLGLVPKSLLGSFLDEEAFLSSF